MVAWGTVKYFTNHTQLIKLLYNLHSGDIDDSQKMDTLAFIVRLGSRNYILYHAKDSEVCISGRVVYSTAAV